MHAIPDSRPTVARTSTIALLTVATFVLVSATQCPLFAPAPFNPVMNVAVETIASGFVSPVDMATTNDGTGRILVADQIGRVLVVDAGGSVLPTPFLDLTDRLVPLNQNDERGLLSIVLHPSFASNGRVFVVYNAPRDADDPAGFDSELRVSEFRVSNADANLADAGSEVVLLDINKPQSNHNGGKLAFGPDGMLYASVGDGGGGGDRGNGHTADIGNAQDLSTFLGKIVRIDVDGAAPYEIPTDNPFNGVDGVREEIWALGFRNPWRFSFDAGGANRMFVGDVGQRGFEEVAVVGKGENHGWRIREGDHCFDPDNVSTPPASCPTVGADGGALIAPIIEQPQRDAEGNAIGVSVIGGFVYRGASVSGLAGDYVFAQWTTQSINADGRLYAATEASDGTWTTRELGFSTTESGKLGRYILAFGQDANGELYILSSESSGMIGTTGRIDRIIAAP